MSKHYPDIKTIPPDRVMNVVKIKGRTPTKLTVDTTGVQSSAVSESGLYEFYHFATVAESMTISIGPSVTGASLDADDYRLPTSVTVPARTFIYMNSGDKVAAKLASGGTDDLYFIRVD